jgi:hypothetical protein
MPAVELQDAPGRHLEVGPPIQRGFTKHSVMLAPITVKNIAITIMIAAPAMI